MGTRPRPMPSALQPAGGWRGSCRLVRSEILACRTEMEDEWCWAPSSLCWDMGSIAVSSSNPDMFIWGIDILLILGLGSGWWGTMMRPGLGWLETAKGPAMGFSCSSSRWEPSLPSLDVRTPLGSWGGGG